MNKGKNRSLIIFLMIGALSVVLAGCTFPTEPQEVSVSVQQRSESNLESESVPKQEEAVPAPETTEIVLDFEGRQVTAVLDNSETTQAFIDCLPLTIPMRRYGDREYYAAISELPENGEKIPDFENGDITYYTTGKSLAIFFGNADSSNQGNLIRMGRITSDLVIFQDLPDTVDVAISLAEGGNQMADYDFSAFSNVILSGVALDTLDKEELAVLYQQARYCQAMTEADTDTMREIVSEDSIFTHMSGRQQTREEYFSDIEDGDLRYYTIGIENPVIEVDGDNASITYTSVLNANAYGARGTYRMSGAHRFEKIDGQWMSTSRADQGE